MLNNFKIGTKLTVGFVLVVGLLILTAGIGWYALYESQRSTTQMMEVQDLLADALLYRRLLNTAQLHSANGTLYRDPARQTARKEVDKEINDVEGRMDGKFVDENAKIYPELVKAYEDFAKEDDQWYMLEAARTKAQDNMVDTAAKVIESAGSSMVFFKERLDESSSKVGDVDKVDRTIVDQMLRVEEYLANVQSVRRNFFRMMAEPNFSKKVEIGGETQADATKLVSDFQKLHDDIGTAAPRRQKALQETIALVHIWIGYLNENITLLTQQDTVGAKQGELSTTMTTYLTDLMANLRSRFADIEKQSAATEALMNTLLIISAIVATIIGLTLAFVLSRNISIGIREAASGIKHVAETGDLTFEIPPQFTNRRDEVGDLAKSTTSVIGEFRKVATMAKQLAEGNWKTEVHIRGELDAMNQDLSSMLDQVNHALNEINESVKQVTTGAGEVSSASTTLSSGAQESAASLEQITASMSEISSQTKQNAENATQARDLAQKATQAAGEGQSAMQQMTGAMDRITTNSNEIQRVIKVIDDIAFQTNLLALNAAVEAARAGQHGKGFAVVAEEVRNLAARSAKAAQETSELIAKSGQEIEKGGEVASHTAEVLDTIVQQIKETTDLVAGIAVASNEQAQGVGQVTVGLQQIDAVTQQNTAAAEESASAANEMSGMATNLQGLVGRFKLR